MRRHFSIFLHAALLLVSTQSIASNAVDVGCRKLQLVLDAKISLSTLEQDWGSGATHDEVPAVLELVGCKGEILDHAVLASPLARIDPAPLRGALAPTYLVSVDLTQIAGSYSGPLTILYQIVGDHLQQVEARADDGKMTPVRVAVTGKSSWKRVSLSNQDIILSVNSEPADTGFVTKYKDFRPTEHGWIMHGRSEIGLWESDGDFPGLEKFQD